MRFKNAVHATEGSEKEKVEATKQLHNDETTGNYEMLAGTMLSCVTRGEGVEGVLGSILQFV